MQSVRDLAASTPASRNRVVDFLRAAAIVVVVLGHWLVAAVVIRDGQVVPNAILNLATWSHPLTWVFQVMPIFFLVGGYANGLSWRSARHDGTPYAAWLRSRVRRLGTPVVPLLLVWLVLTSIAYAAGTAPGTLRTASQVALVPTWFLAAYVLVVAIAPGTLWAWDRFGWVSVIAGLALGATVDATSIGLGSDAIGFANYLVVWATVHQLGYAWLDGRLAGVPRRVTLAVVGALALVVLVWLGPYPVSMIGVDNAALNNSYPTRVTLAFLGFLQAGIILLAEPRLQRWLERETPWRATVLVNARIMTLYLWHLTGMVAVIAASLALGGFGLGPEPLSGSWWATRPAWYAVLGLVTLGLISGFGRFETPRPDERPAPPAWVPVIATIALCGGLGVMAAQGLVNADGLRWWWPLLPIAGLAVLGRAHNAEARSPQRSRRALVPDGPSLASSGASPLDEDRHRARRHRRRSRR